MKMEKLGLVALIAYFCNQMSVRTILSGMAKNNCDYSYLQKTLNEIYTKV